VTKTEHGILGNCESCGKLAKLKMVADPEGLKWGFCAKCAEEVGE